MVGLRKRKRTEDSVLADVSSKKNVQNETTSRSKRQKQQKDPAPPAKKQRQQKVSSFPPKKQKVGKKQSPRKNLAAVENTESDSDEEQVQTLHKRMQQNMQDNQAFLASLGMSDAVSSFRETIAEPIVKKKTSSRGLREKKEREVLPPRERSLRLQNKDPTGNALPENFREPSYVPYTVPINDHPRVAGPLDMSKALVNLKTEVDQSQHDQFLQWVKSGLNQATVKKSENVETEKFLKGVRQMKITETRVAKVVPNRIFSVAVHPMEDKVLVAAGGKWGKVGLWDVEMKTPSSQAGVYCYAVHSAPVKHMVFDIHNNEKFYTCSYDGTVRCTHLSKGISEEVYLTDPDYKYLLTGFDFNSPQTMLVSQGDGDVALVDIRQSIDAKNIYELDHKSVRSVSVHPRQQEYFVTAHSDGTVNLWDSRKMTAKKNKPIGSQKHFKASESAYFSPISGDRVVSCSTDDSIVLWDTSNLAKGLQKYKTIRHNNQTGRWLTKFRPIWHPTREDIIITGSMHRPRQIEIFDDNLRLVHTFQNEDYLGSVCSINAFHPTRNILAGGNASGKLHVFM